MADHPLLEVNNRTISAPIGADTLPQTSNTNTGNDRQQSGGHTKLHQFKMIPESLDVIGKVNGNFGKWQLRTVLLIFLVKIPSSWFMACIIFTAPAPRHGEFFCKPPVEMAVHAIANKTEWIKVSHPTLEEKKDKEFNIDFCNVYDDAFEHAKHYYNQTDGYNPWLVPKRNSNIIPCEEFEHHADYHSLITQYDLVCSRDILVATTQFFHLFGVLLGGLTATKLLQSISPRRVMLIGMLAQIACGNITGLVPYYGLHILFRCLSAVCCALMYTAGQMIFCDITSGKARTIICCMFEQFWSIGVIMLPGLASFFNSWSHLYMAISLPTFFLIFLRQWIPDSPRWMLQRGRVAEAKAILIKSAEMNDRTRMLPKDLDAQLQVQASALLKEPPAPGWWAMWQGYRVTRHLIAVHLAWSIYIVVYYGMLLNIRAFSREHLYINTVIAGLCEILGTFIGLALILWTTKKWFWTSAFNIVAGGIAYTAWIIPEEIKGNNRVAALMLSAMISKVAISTTLSMLTTCTTEIVSGEKKWMCGFSTIVWARIWLLTAPFIGATVIFGQLIPQTALATLSIIGALMTSLIDTPRTIPKQEKGGNLPTELSAADIWVSKEEPEKIRI